MLEYLNRKMKARTANIPSTNSEGSMAFRTLDATRRSTKASALAARFENRIIGQSVAKEKLVNVIEKFNSGMFDRTKPIASLLFLGPTGSGKTATVEAFVEGLFHSPIRMMKVDCAEFQHSHEIAKLVGSPPGYLGHRETHPYFTNASVTAARSDASGKDIQGFTVILFDEIEKASDALWNLLLGILDKGTLTTGTNEKVDMTSTVIVMTSNIGAAETSDDKSLGFNTGEQVDDKKREEIVMSAARKKFLPEFLNRLDHVVMFKTLTPDDMEKILPLALEKVQDRIVLGVGTPLFEFRVSEAGMSRLRMDGYDKRYGARFLNRTIEKAISDPLTRLVATEQIEDGDIVVCDYNWIGDAWIYRSVGNMKHASAPESSIPSRISA
jgi:ATP-dependent Clp protease ATP-binding subunit ClpB